MSEEILKALTQLFAIITKQDGGVTETERSYVISFFKTELDQETLREYLALYDKFADYNKEPSPEDEEKAKKKKLTSVRDSVKTLAICKKINRTLEQKQKVVVLIKILELVASDGNFTPQRMEIVDTISTVFNISKEEYKVIEAFLQVTKGSEHQHEHILVVNGQDKPAGAPFKHIKLPLNGELFFLSVPSVDMFFVRYIGEDDTILNGFTMQSHRVYLFSNGSTVKTKKGFIYYSAISNQFAADFTGQQLSFEAKNLWFQFPNGAFGLRNINISEGPGNLLGIMGASGAGKTTLLNALAGIESPSEGQVLINGIDIHREKERIRGVIGYISQDDLLIEELTVYQNLYYNAKLCFADVAEEELHKRVMDTLESLGLDQRAHLKVGSVLDKTISGGQRKRLNIALELIREPAVMFVDEPTSGLSSRDSENVIDLLKELTLKGKIIFVVIHQPSSDIYKMFDKMYIMDTGGYPVFYGNPVEAVTYFKHAANQVDADRGACPTCGNVNPEQIFNIIEAKVVDEYGQFTNKRKVNPTEWNSTFEDKFTLEEVPMVTDEPPNTLRIPNKVKQSWIFTVRDTLSKITNKQYLLINLLEAPLLAFILAAISRYRNAPDGEYLFRFNENYPIFLMMSIVVALFMGLTVSAEEIIRDRKILKRESFLNLSWNSYLLSKVLILFTLSAIQTITYVVIANLILGVRELYFYHWLSLFSVSCFANVLGLNISSAFRSAVTVYILIPLLIIPQMVLSGLLFSFDKLNDLITTKGKVPLVADLMVSRWAYEALAVKQYKSNGYMDPKGVDFAETIYDYELAEKQSDFKASYLYAALEDQLAIVNENYKDTADSSQQVAAEAMRVLRNEIRKDEYLSALDTVINIEESLSLQGYSPEVEKLLATQLAGMKQHYLEQFLQAIETKEKYFRFLTENVEGYTVNEARNKYFNEPMSDLLRNLAVDSRVLEYRGELLQQVDPIYQVPKAPSHALDYRSHFFAPQKHFLGRYWPTFTFNMVVVWLTTLVLYFLLYFEVLRKLVSINWGALSLKKKG